MYAYQDSSFVYAGPERWHAEPVRPAWRLVLLFLVTVVVLPVWWALLLALAVALIVVAMFAEILTVIPGFESGAERFMDATIGRIPVWPRWWVTWPELRHEGDADFYRARVDTYLDKWTKKASAPRKKGVSRTTECEVPLRKYRGVGGEYVVQAASARGWELRPSDPRDEIRLWWSAASEPGATGPSRVQ